jgi:hypothetical protein
MRLFLTLICFLASTAAMAFPEVGDWAKYDGEFTTPQGQKINYELTQELIGYDAQTDVFTMRVTSEAGGKQDIQEAQVGRDQFLPTDRIQKLVDFCVASGVGVNLQTPAGIFPACVQPTENGGRMAFGVVPFGILMSDFRAPAGSNLQILKAFGTGH